MVKINTATGRLPLDEKFGGEGASHPGLDFGRREWPHGATGGAIVHGALFGP